MILFFDTETTGFYQDRLPVDHEDQPYIVQLAAQLCSASGDPVAGFSVIIDPGVEIPERASSVHGITTEKAIQFGVNAQSALSLFVHLYQRSELIVAHNIKFDKAILETGISRYYGKPMPLDRKPIFCTMRANLRAATLLASSDLAPVMTILPEPKMRAVVFGSRMRIITAVNRFGLYSALRA